MRREAARPRGGALMVVALVLLLMSSCVSKGPGAPPARQPPNLLLITVDMLPRQFLSSYNRHARITTPAIDGLAARGTLFERAYSQADITAPAHMCIFASHYLSQMVEMAWRPGETLASMLKRRGYQTAAFPSTCLLNPDRLIGIEGSPMGYGFDVYEPVPWPDPRHPLWNGKRRGSEINRMAIDWLRRQAAQMPPRPWFALVNYRELHPPIALPVPYANTLEGALAHQDRLIGELLDAVSRLGFAESTVIVFTGDHGGPVEFLWKQYEHDKEHTIPNIGLTEHDVHVPLIVVAPDAPHGQRVSRVVQASVDLLPTLARMADAKPPLAVEGRDLFDPNRPASALAFSETGHLGAEMVTDGRWKYVEYTTTFKVDHGYKPAGTCELYDLQVDPEEQHNLVRQRPDVAARLRRALDARFPTRRTRTLNPLQQERLKVLDYW